MHLRSIEYFRGIAIVLIVAGHCYSLSNWQFPSILERSLANILTGGTALFVFISGFLFHHVFYPRFQFRPFMAKKIRNVLAPYLFFSLFGISYALIMQGPYPEFFFGPGDSSHDRFVRPALLYLLTGAELWAYWYIPFIMIIFALSPLFILYIKAGPGLRLCVFAVSLLLAMMVQRPVDNLLVPQSVLFYVPVYLAGIFISQNKEELQLYLEKREGLLFLGVVMLACIQALIYAGAGSMHAPLFVWNGLDINIVQKILLSLLFMIFLHRFEQQCFPVLSSLAQASFAIFFIHCWIILALMPVLPPVYAAVHLHPLLALITSTVLVLALSYQVSCLIRHIFPRQSRLLIGW